MLWPTKRFFFNFSNYFYFLFFKNSYWNIVDLQCVLVSDIQQSDSDTYIFFFYILFHYILLQDIEYIVPRAIQ